MLRPDVLAARIDVRVAELRLLAAATFLQRSRQPPRARGLLGNATKIGAVADAPWRPSPSARRDSIRASRPRRDGDGR
jgi:hypothetical protein